MRVFALSDIHVDHKVNNAWITGLSDSDFQDDTLLLAGDVTHDLQLLIATFEILLSKFKNLFFVPGNHDLWVMPGNASDSIQKFRNIIEICNELSVKTQPEYLGTNSDKVLIVPLFSWYTQPDEGKDSLYIPKDDENISNDMWSDNYFIKWPNTSNDRMIDFFLELNEEHLSLSCDGHIISFSHFLPRSDIILPIAEESAVIKRSHRNETFNFTRVAGSKLLDLQIRRLGSTIHVYGHQHRNRYRNLDGVCYVSCCLGYEYERLKGDITPEFKLPKEIWNDGMRALLLNE